MKKNDIIRIDNNEIHITNLDEQSYLSLTDILKTEGKKPEDIKSWLRSQRTIQFLIAWEKKNNNNFIEKEALKLLKALGVTNRISVDIWREKTGAIGIFSKKGRNGGTYAHRHIAIDFAAWIKPELQLLLIEEIERYHRQFNDQGRLDWDIYRRLARNNYGIQTEAVKRIIIPNCGYPKNKEWVLYANEADVLNVALFGCTAKQFKAANPGLKSDENMRDFASTNKNTVMLTLESHNAQMIIDGLKQPERLEKLVKIAERELKILDSRNPKNAKQQSFSLINDGRDIKLLE